MKTRNVVKSLAAALLLSSSAVAQFQISGTVKGDEGEPLTGAVVLIKGQQRGTTTDKYGKYSITNLQSGKYDLKVRYFGYKEEEKTVVITDQNVQVDFQLKSTIFMQEGIEVQAIRADQKTPTTFTNIDEEEIERKNYGQDLPFLLQSTPSTVVTSDAGAGVGYTGVRIRGVDPTRTNVTVNGIPLNDPESQGVFWVNMPDFASSVESMQVQRGVGTSSNGSGAFGASINISTHQQNEKAYAEIDNSGGSFNTLRNSVRAGTGLLNNKFTLDTRLSRVVSDGYIDRASSDLKSFYVSGAYHGEKSTLRINIFSGKERTYQAWYGTPESRIEGDVDEMLAYAMRNGLSQEETENLLNSGRTYNFYTYENEVDNYQQDHYQLHFAHQFSNKLNMNLATHYTYGRGYYEQFRENDRFSTYGYDPLVVEGDTLTRMDLIRRRWLDNHFYGGVYNLIYKSGKGLELTLGGAVNKYDGDHFGEVIWAEFMPDNEMGDRYYDNSSVKIDASNYLKGTYQLNKFTFFGDIQMRYIDYTFLGVDEVDNQIVDLEQNVKYNFVNPKAGLTYRINSKQSVYASYAVANREPVRRDFRESTPANRPKHETLYNLEAGYRYEGKKGFVNANVYHMDYQNQLVLTGEINDVGGYTRTNVENSYRMGVEFEGGYQILKNLGLTGNLALSQNKIENFTEYVDAYDASFNYIGQEAINHGTTDLAFSPSVIGGVNINYEPIKDLQISLLNKYVGKQYLDNTSNESRALDPYYIAHLNISYTIRDILFKEIVIGLRANNIFDEMYENNGYTFSYLVAGERTQENFYYPQAGRHYWIRLLLKL
ncbi:MAG: TonB-dependent receptor [Brumimicrobium sp.]|nr:TonB-dependent receptor [Brumimicrobium sp.]